MDNFATAKLLRLIASQVERLEESQVADLLAGRLKFVLSGPHRSEKTSKHGKVDPVSHELVVSDLNAAPDRERAREILQTIPRREDLARLARHMRIHVVKADRREAIEAKIIEFVIGGRLRTEAIRSLNLKDR